MAIRTAAEQSTGGQNEDGGWSVSYAEASREPAGPQAAQGRLDANWYSCGNNNSVPFFRKMQQSLEEAERLRQQCRASASVSAARNDEEKAQMHFFHNTIGDARAAAEFARAATQRGDTHDEPAREVLDRGAPIFLGHLSVPRAAPIEGKPLKETIQAVSDTTLPGMVEDDTAETNMRSGSEQQASNPREAAEDAVSPLAAAPAQGQGSWEEGEARRQSGGSGAGSGGGSGGAGGGGSGGGSRGGSHGGSQVGSGGSRASRRSAEGTPPQETDTPNRRDGQSSMDDSLSDSSSSYSEESDRWPPRPPMMRFKNRVQFSGRFQPMDGKELVAQENEEAKRECESKHSHAELNDMTIGWVNKVFEMDVHTEYQFEIGFPIIILSMLDAIYPNRVRWREVDWRFQYKRALVKNFTVLERIWGEVNMEKAREFRVENTHLRMEGMSEAPVKEKLDFLRLAKRWFDTRIHHAAPYDPKAKRHEVLKQCKMWGHDVRFPAWIKFDKDAEAPRIVEPTFYSKMPEYKRLIWFLGSPEHQTM